MYFSGGCQIASPPVACTQYIPSDGDDDDDDDDDGDDNDDGDDDDDDDDDDDEVVTLHPPGCLHSIYPQPSSTVYLSTFQRLSKNIFSEKEALRNRSVLFLFLPKNL